MKVPHVLYQVLCILVFGLISCSSDETSVQPDQELQISAEIENQDQTIQRIRETKSLRVSSRIALDVVGDSQSHDTSLVTSSCRRSSQQDVLERETSFSSETEFDVTEILPSRAFAPSTAKSLTVLCDITIHLFHQERSVAKVNLLDVRITDIEDYSNYELPFLKPNGETYLLRSDVGNNSLELPFELGRVETLCENTSNFAFTQSPQAKLSDFLLDELFAFKNLEKCRLLLRQEDSKKIWISKSFYIQNHDTVIETPETLALSGQPTMERIDEPLLKYEIFNAGKSTAFVTMTVPAPSVTMTPTYGSSSEPFASFIETHEVPSHWVIVGAIPTNSKNKRGATIYALSPGSSIVFLLKTDFSIRCPIAANQRHNQPNPQKISCQSGRAFIGFHYDIAGVPTFQRSIFDDPAKTIWSNEQSVKPHPLALGLASYFAKNKRIGEICSRWDGQSTNTNDKRPMDYGYVNILACN